MNTERAVAGEASETDEENEIQTSSLKESIENVLNSNTMVQSLVIQGEASESDEELPRIQNLSKSTEPITSSNVPSSTNQSFLMQDLQEDVTNSLKWLIQDTQEIALEELTSCNQLLLSSQVVLQKDTSALRTAAANLENVSKKLDDILSFNFIPQIEFQKKISDADGELGVDTLTNEMIEML